MENNIKKTKTQSYLFGTMHIYLRGQIDFVEKVIPFAEKSETLALERNITNGDEQKIFMEHLSLKMIQKPYQVILEKYSGSISSMEAEFIELFQRQNKKIIGLETSQEALKIIEGIDDIDQHNPNGILKDFHEMQEEYKSEQLQRIMEKYRHQIGDNNLKILLEDRNELWMTRLDCQLEKESTFVAVGAGHLFGEKGLLNMLEDKQHTLKRMFIN